MKRPKYTANIYSGVQENFTVCMGESCKLTRKTKEVYTNTNTIDKKTLENPQEKPFIFKGNWKIPDRITCNWKGCKWFKGNSCNSCWEIICSVSEKAKIEKQPKGGKVVFSWHFGYTQAKILSVKVETLLKLPFFFKWQQMQTIYSWIGVFLLYTCHYNLFLIWKRSWLLTAVLLKNFLV